MKRIWIYIACLLAGAAAWNGAAACAQTDIAASIDGAFSGTATSGVDRQSPSNSAGGLLEVRRIDSSLMGIEAAYSYNRANQVYSYTVPIGLPCPPPGGCYARPIAVSANAHAITGDWVVSRKMRNFRPFALAGGGLLLVIPSSGQKYTSTAAEFLFVLGAGLDWKLSSHIGLRLQYRENIYKAPQLLSTEIYPLASPRPPNVYTYTQEPALGVYYRF